MTPPESGKEEQDAAVVDSGTPAVGRTRRGSPTFFIVGVTVLAVVVGLVALRGTSDGTGPGAGGDQTTDPAAETCGAATPDPSYTVTTESEPNPPRPEGTTIHFTVRHGGQAVIGADVCLALGMPAMEHSGVSEAAKEGGSGRYDVAMSFSMGGAWSGVLRIAEPGRPAVAVPVQFEVSAS